MKIKWAPTTCYEYFRGDCFFPSGVQRGCLPTPGDDRRMSQDLECEAESHRMAENEWFDLKGT